MKTETSKKLRQKNIANHKLALVEMMGVYINKQRVKVNPPTRAIFSIDFLPLPSRQVLTSSGRTSTWFLSGKPVKAKSLPAGQLTLSESIPLKAINYGGVLSTISGKRSVTGYCETIKITYGTLSGKSQKRQLEHDVKSSDADSKAAKSSDTNKQVNKAISNITDTEPINNQTTCNNENISSESQAVHLEDVSNGNCTASCDDEIDYCRIKVTSPDRYRENSPQVQPDISVICDGITLTTHVDDDRKQSFAQDLRKACLGLKLKGNKKIRLYKHGRCVYNGTKRIAVIYFEPIDESNNYLYLHINPDRLDANDCELITAMMERLLQDSWCSILDQSNISAIDTAVDVIGVHISEILAVPSRAKQSGYFLTFRDQGRTRDYIQGTEYIGHQTSEVHATVYDKAAETDAHTKVKSIGHKTRVEVQFKPRIRSQFGSRSCTLSDLSEYRNPLKMLSITNFPKDASNNESLSLLIPLAAVFGLTAALEFIKNKENKKIYKAYLNSLQCSWWKPAQLWTTFLQVLFNSPLFSSCNHLPVPVVDEPFTA